MNRFILVIVAVGWLTCTLQSQPVKRVLIEESSYATCSQCPEGGYWLDSILREFPEVIGVSYHIYHDSMTFPESEAWGAEYVAGAPLACIDRLDFGGDGFVAEGVPQWRNRVIQRQPEPGYVDIHITGTWDAPSRVLDVEVNYVFDTAPDSIAPLQTTLLIIEDSVIGFGPGYDQHNLYNMLVGHPYYGAGDPIVGYPHRHVVRKIMTSSTEIQFPVTLHQPYDYDFSASIPAQWNAGRMSVVAFVNYNDTDVIKRTVINAQEKVLSDLDAPSGEKTPVRTESLMIVPNPAHNTSTVTLKGIEDQAEVIIINNLGVVCYRSLCPGSEVMDLSEFAPGIYFVQVGASTSKLVVIE